MMSISIFTTKFDHTWTSIPYSVSCIPTCMCTWTGYMDMQQNETLMLKLRFVKKIIIEIYEISDNVFAPGSSVASAWRSEHLQAEARDCKWRMLRTSSSQRLRATHQFGARGRYSRRTSTSSQKHEHLSMRTCWRKQSALNWRLAGVNASLLH